MRFSGSIRRDGLDDIVDKSLASDRIQAKETAIVVLLPYSRHNGITNGTYCVSTSPHLVRTVV